MSKVAPRRYGERLLDAAYPKNPLHVLHQVSLADLTDAQSLLGLIRELAHRTN